MDLRRNGSPVTRQWNVGSSNTVSPAHRLGNGVSAIKRTQKVAAKTAVKRFAQVMATRRVDDDDVENDDLRLRYFASTTLPPSPGAKSLGNGVSVNITRGFASTKANRSPSHALGQNIVEHRPSVRSASVGRSSTSVHTANMVPSSKSSLRSPVSVIPIEHPTSSSRERGFTLELGQTKRETGYEHEVSALRDELDMLQEENEDILNRLHRAEKRCEEAEARARELEKQVASLGEGVSLEAKLMSRKEAALRQREAALKAKKESYEQKDEEISALRLELENLKDETAKAMDQLQEAQSEVKALHTMTERMILTAEEMEEVVLKRCWLARYWGLAAQHGICADIAASKHEHWSALAPLPVELVISAGQKAKNGSWVKANGFGNPDTKKSDRKLSDLNGEGNIEAMLSVEIGLRELASLKVEHAVMLELAQHRRPSMVRKSTSTEVSDSRSSSDQKFIESDELSNEEAEDVLFKQAWLAYFWRRAVVHGIENDIAEERLHFWISRSYGPSLTSQDALDVERGLMELRKLSIEQQLWEASRREIDQPLPTLSPDDKSDTEPEIS